MRRSVAVSKGTFLGDGVGGAFAGDSKTPFLDCSASMTERALASESLRGRVTIGLDSGVAGASYFGFGGTGEVWGPKIRSFGGRMDFLGRTVCGLLSSSFGDPDLRLPRLTFGLVEISSKPSSSNSGEEGGDAGNSSGSAS